MQRSFRGHLLPESAVEYGSMTPIQRKYCKCVVCKKDFSSKNVKTRRGWLETQISGFCETCFDNLAAEPEPDPAIGAGLSELATLPAPLPDSKDQP